MKLTSVIFLIISIILIFAGVFLCNRARDEAPNDGAIDGYVDKGTMKLLKKLHSSLPFYPNLLEQRNTFYLYHPLPYHPLLSFTIPFFTFLKQFVEHNVRGQGGDGK